MDFVGEGSFIVILGPPQEGKRERVSKVRSHITRRYFAKRNQNDRTGEPGHAKAIRLSSPPKDENNLRRAVGPVLSPEIPYPILSADHPMRDPTFFASETTRRLQKFFSHHTRGNIYLQSFPRSIIAWAIAYPHYTSGKLLNASGWDDVQGSGELSVWTLRQRFITIRLIDHTLKAESKGHKDSTIAAIQSLLSFEILIGDGENYLLLRKFSRAVIDQGVQCEDDIWKYLTRGFFLLDQTNRLRMASSIATKPSTLELPFDFQFLFPVDLALFTLGSQCSSSDTSPSYSLMIKLYTILSIADSSGVAPLSKDSFDYIASCRNHLSPDIVEDTGQEERASGINENTSTTPTRLCIFMLASYLLSSSEIHPNQSLSQLSSQMRTLLSKAGIGADYGTAWTPFPGALLWCCAIGVRFAGPRDKTWFLMQFLRVSHSWLLEKWEETSKNICLVSRAVENMQPLRLEES